MLPQFPSITQGRTGMSPCRYFTPCHCSSTGTMDTAPYPYWTTDTRQSIWFVCNDTGIQIFSYWPLAEMLPFTVTHVPKRSCRSSSALSHSGLQPSSQLQLWLVCAKHHLLLCQQHCFLFLPLTDIFGVISISSLIKALSFTVCTAGSTCLLSCLRQLTQQTLNLNHSPFGSCIGQAQNHLHTSTHSHSNCWF